MSEQEKPEVATKKEKGFIEELLGDVFNLDRGLPATVLGMIKTPGVIIDSYFTDRGKYVTPLRYCIFILAVTTFISTRFIDYEEMMRNAMELGAGESMDVIIDQYSQLIPSVDWEAYFNAVGQIGISLIQKFNQILYLVLLAPVMAFFLKLFFKHKKSRFVEHYVLMVYSLTTFAIFSVALIPVMKLLENTESILSFLFSAPLILGYLLWTTGKYLNLKRFSEYMQVLIALTLGYIVYSIAQTIIMYVGAYFMVVWG